MGEFQPFCYFFGDVWPASVIFLSFLWNGRVVERILMGAFRLAAGEVLFAEVLVTPTGVSKGCG